MKSLFCAVAAVGAMVLMSAPATANSHMEGKLPKCSAKVTDACDQSKTTEKYALTAAQAEASGGVGDRVAIRSTPAKKKMVRHHKMTTKTKTITQ